jgi:hypothetical protein
MTISHSRHVRGLALAAVIGALAAPSASAAPAEQFFPRAEDESARRSSSVPPPPSSIAAAAAEQYDDLRSPDATTVPVRVVQVRADAGFDWGDAGIGATGVLALMAIGVGAAIATGHRPGARHNPQPIS